MKKSARCPKTGRFIAAPKPGHVSSFVEEHNYGVRRNRLRKVATDAAYLGYVILLSASAAFLIYAAAAAIAAAANLNP